MKATNNKLAPKIIKLDSEERYMRLFSIKNGDAISFRSGYVILKENENIGEHNTGNAEEILIILEGKGELYINGREKLNFEEGTAVYIPPGTVHDVKNTGKGLLKYIFVTTGVVVGHT